MSKARNLADIGSDDVLETTATGVNVTGDMNIDSGTLFVDASTNKVGIGTTSPTTKLEVAGNIGFGTGGTFAAGQLYSDPNWGVILRAKQASPAQAEFAFYNAGGSERMRISSTGNVGIGGYTNNARVRIRRDNPTQYDNSHLELVSDAGNVMLGFHALGATAVNLRHVRATNDLQVINAVATAFSSISASAFNVNSDYRIKENITSLTGAVDRIAKLPVHQFSFVEGSMSYNDGKIVDGFLAHEVQSVVPEAVTGEKDEVDKDGEPVLQSIDQSKLVPLLTGALQELIVEVETLKAEIQTLKGN